ncbi:RNA polymerase-binding protein DksA [uncultured Desulfatiglans sp.]|uniref:RNA polymerase-binding transcription factor DksA n=1 Tax=Uncultured Desulfatiglans sp. TaxID=1748965 RepID=A0A653AAQ8_UNCDX|nr:RNA polymerase-binding protein DksA [uncultured Desulfatiglans sp.]
MMMTEEKKEEFRKLLNERMEALLEEANKTVSGMTDQRENYPDPTDRASMESERNFTLRIRDRERKLIGKIKEALERLDSGTFGICESCGEDISEERLKARPVTTLCIECKKKQENEERLRGV